MVPETSTIEILKFKEKIVSAFADLSTPNTPLVNHDCEECLQLQNAFSNKSWNGISPALIKNHFDGLPLFTAEAFHAFLPAFIIYSIENLGNIDGVSEFTAFALLPHKSVIDDEGFASWWKSRLGLFSDEQFAVLLEYLDLVEQTDEYFDRERMSRGRERLIKLRNASINHE